MSSQARKLIPLFTRVLVKRVAIPKQTKIGGVLIPESAGKKQPAEGIVVAVGTGTEDKKPILKEGDRVLLPDYKGHEVNFDGEEYDIYREDEIVGLIQEKQ